jgi:two-component system LytT family response regulator
MAKKETTVNAIIADDETLARNVIRKYLLSFPQIKIIAECSNGLAALNKINELQPDLVFLDIQMPDLDGLSLLGELKHLPLVIFITAFDQYAVRAFELNAVDYLLKPFDKDRFATAVKKVMEQKISPAFLEKKINSIQASLNQVLHSGENFISRILIKGKSGYSFLDVQEITWFEADSDYVKIHTREKVFLKNISLNELESKLNPGMFIRIHRSSIVNIKCIKEMKPYFNGEYHLYLTTGQELKLSRSYKDKVKQIIGESI